MSNRINSIVTTIGIDIGKNAFHVVGLDQRGAIVLRQRWSRRQVEVRLANMPPCLVGMEACVGAHHLSRRLQSQGHDARLMPAKYVRPYSKGQKNDFRDAEAIAEAVQRPTMKFVPTKLERGIAVRQGLRFLRAELPIILATRSDVLSGCRGTSRRLASTGPADCRSVPRNRTLSRSGSSLSAAYNRAGHWTDHLKCHGGRDRQRRGIHQGTRLRRLARTGAQQISTGDRTILGAISRRGNRYLRALFVQAAWVVLIRIKDWDRYGLKIWIEAAKKRLHHNVLAIALANRPARIAWAVLNKERAFECVKTHATTSQPA